MYFIRTYMSLFTSDRERRLWIWTLVIIVAIYSTLGLQGRLVAILQDLNLLVGVYISLLVLMVLAIIGSAIKRRIGRYEVWVTLGIAAVYGMLVVRLFLNPVERTHLFEYGLVGVLIYKALEERNRNGRRAITTAIIAIIATSLLGWLDEGIQAILPNRVYDIRDVGFNALAGLMAVTASLLLSRVRLFRHRKDKK